MKDLSKGGFVFPFIESNKSNTKTKRKTSKKTKIEKVQRKLH